MSNDPYKPPKATLNSTAQLGPILVSCRNRSHKECLEAMNRGLTRPYLVPLAPPFVVGKAIMSRAVSTSSYTPPISWFQITLIGVSLLTTGWMYWLLLRTPKKPMLVLHEQGFCYKKMVFLFDELSSIKFGYRLSNKKSSLFARKQPSTQLSGEPESPPNSKGLILVGSMTLVFKTGVRRLLRDMQICPIPEDLQLFFDRLRSLRPGLLDETTAPQLTAPGVDDLPFKMTPC